MRFEEWTVAFREKKKHKTLLNDLNSEFHIIHNTWRYWCADPHIFEWNGTNYVFAELYDRILRRGVIGVCAICEDKVSKWEVVLKEAHHLSYPHIFCDGSAIYMIPESYVAQEIDLYIAEDFPRKWKKISVLKDHFVAVDSTMVEYENKKWMFTLQFDNDNELFKIFSLDEKQLKNETVIAINDLNKRPGGKVFKWNGKLIRPAQDCTKGYGNSLNFFEIKEIGEKRYEEELFCKIDSQAIKSDFGKEAKGIHTYNFNEFYEVIDFKSYERDIFFWIVRPIWYVWRKIKRLFEVNNKAKE